MTRGERAADAYSLRALLSESLDHAAYWSVTELEVGEADQSGLVVTLQPSLTITGRVVAMSADSHGVAGVNVSLAQGRATGPWNWAHWFSGTTDAQGGFTIKNVLPGDFTWRVSSEKGEGLRIASIRTNDQLAPGVDQKIGPDEPTSAAVITLAPF